MVEVDGKWIMSGYENFDEAALKKVEDLMDYVKKVGFLPLFSNSIPGFSVEELTYRYGWWGDNPQIDPWTWREVVSGSKEVAYGKLFLGKAGFISKEYYPLFARIRRDGYDFDSRYEDGLASRRAKMIIDTLEQYESLPSYQLKDIAGFGKGKEKGFDSVISQLQMQTYITVSGFSKKKNKRGEDYGWSVASYCLSEKLFTCDFVTKNYSMPYDEALSLLLSKVKEQYQEVDETLIIKLLRG